jgi:hypothetical protein
MTHRAFTLDEANEMLPEVRAVLSDLRDLREAAQGAVDQLAVLDALWGKLVVQSTNPDHQEYVLRRRALSEYSRAMDNLIQERLINRDVRFPVGGLENGLVDFPTTLDGRWVYLCWQSQEPRIAYWHEVSGGYAGRRQITSGQRFGRSDDPAHDDDSTLDF